MNLGRGRSEHVARLLRLDRASTELLQQRLARGLVRASITRRRHRAKSPMVKQRNVIFFLSVVQSTASLGASLRRARRVSTPTAKRVRSVRARGKRASTELYDDKRNTEI